MSQHTSESQNEILLPHVILNAAMSVDGRISTVARRSKISSALDLKRVHQLRSEVDAIMVGINTVLVDDPLLTNRSGSGKSPVRVIIDSRCQIPISSRVLDLQPGYPRTIIACTKSKTDNERLEQLKRKRPDEVEVVQTPDYEGRVDLHYLLSFLAKERNIRQVLLEGGGELNWSALSAGLVKELMITVSPIVLGGRDSISLVTGKGVEIVEDAIKLKLLKMERLETTDEVILSYEVLSKRAE